ncbi:MAG: zinc-binding dehydrogenase [Firmicutes bacterium]|nr:zinc-binding dehydrogenase [Bacillota bacterium]
MTKTMKAGVMTAPYEFEIRELPVPEPGPGEVLIRQRAVALCTMEQRVYTGVKKFPYPGCWGHEVSGVVEKIGPDCQTDLQVGDHVALGVPYFCGECDNCSKGLEEHCVKKAPLPKIDGVVGLFGMAEYMVIASKRALKISKDIPFEQAALTEPLACVLQGIKKVNVRLGDTVVVIGAGTMGLLNVLAAKSSGARVIVSELDAGRREKALKLGADAVINPAEEDVEVRVQELNEGKKAEAVIITIGNKHANDDAIKMVANYGSVLYFASAHPGEPLDINPNLIHDTGIALTGVKGKNLRDMWDAAALISKGIISTAELIEETQPLADAKAALDKASNNATYRIVLTM